jgi:hypothetical protein
MQQFSDENETWHEHILVDVVTIGLWRLWKLVFLHLETKTEMFHALECCNQNDRRDCSSFGLCPHVKENQFLNRNYIFWDITLSSLRNDNRCVRGTYCFHLQG